MSNEEVTKPAPLLDETGLAESPYERWPGYIKFPEVMNRSHYRIVMQHRAALSKDDGDSDSDDLKAMIRLEDGAPKVVRLSDLDLMSKIVESIDLGDVDIFADDAPIKLVHWAIECTEEWLDSQLSFRVRGDSDMA